MRDILLLCMLPLLIFFAIKRPFIGLALWFWTTLVPIQTWSYGVATSIRWNLIFALATMLGYVFMRNKPKVKFDLVFYLMFLLIIHSTFSSFFHQGFDILVWNRWETFLKSFIFLIFVYLIVDKRLHVEALIWACVLSVTATAVIQGLKVFFSGGHHVVYGISPTFNDNNLSAFAALTCIPLTIYLVDLYKPYLVIKIGLLGGILISTIFILGSDSRGAFLGLLVLAFYFFIKSNKKFSIIIVGALVAGVGLSLMDASWFERMNTISNAGEDGSFMGRVIAWKLSILMALDSPIFGGGFDAVAYQPTWLGLLTHWNEVNFIPSPYPTVGHVAHSIYFQVLGDLGFVGFILYFAIIFIMFKRYSYIATHASEDSWLKPIALYCSLATVCFVVAGAALSVAYNEITIMLIALSAKLMAIYLNQLNEPKYKTDERRQ